MKKKVVFRENVENGQNCKDILEKRTKGIFITELLKVRILQETSYTRKCHLVKILSRSLLQKQEVYKNIYLLFL